MTSIIVSSTNNSMSNRSDSIEELMHKIGMEYMSFSSSTEFEEHRSVVFSYIA
jgi:hypothetical protein